MPNAKSSCGDFISGQNNNAFSCSYVFQNKLWSWWFYFLEEWLQIVWDERATFWKKSLFWPYHCHAQNLPFCKFKLWVSLCSLSNFIWRTIPARSNFSHKNFPLLSISVKDVNNGCYLEKMETIEKLGNP